MIGAATVHRDYQAVDDGKIVERVISGDAELYEVLMRRYNQRLFRAARAILGDDGRAEEAVQESYLRAYTKLGTLVDRAAFGAWITRITVREALARRRAVAREGSYEVDPDTADVLPLWPPHASDPEQAAADAEMRSVLEAAIERLPDGAREVFVLRDVEQLSTAETAACLDVSAAAVRVRLHRARAALRDELARALGSVLGDVYAFAGDRCDRIVAAVLSAVGDL